MSKEKDYAIILCDKCEKEYKIEFEYISDVIGMNCPECNSDKIWYMKFVQHDEDSTPLVMGRGGALHTGKQT